MEKINFFYSKDLGLNIDSVIAIRNNGYPSSIGGCRYIEYKSIEDMKQDLSDLSLSMQNKLNVLSLKYNGAKSAISKKPNQKDEMVFEEFGYFVDSLKGKYITGTDMGTDVKSMIQIKRYTPYVSCIPEDISFDETSYITGAGCVFALTEAMKSISNSNDVDFKKLKIAVIGLGKTGSIITEMLCKLGAKVQGFDIDQNKSSSVNHQNFTFAKSSNFIFENYYDAIMPCSNGGMVNEEFVSKIKTKIICGAANNQLSSNDVIEALKQRKINYVTDFVANCGGAFIAVRRYENPKVKIENVENDLKKIIASSVKQISFIN